MKSVFLGEQFTHRQNIQIQIVGHILDPSDKDKLDFKEPFWETLLSIVSVSSILWINTSSASLGIERYDQMCESRPSFRDSLCIDLLLLTLTPFLPPSLLLSGLYGTSVKR